MVQPARQALTAAATRRLFRSGAADATACTAEGYVQANLVAVPKDWAYDVLLFAQRNPRACPLIEVAFLFASTVTFEPALTLSAALARAQAPLVTTHSPGHLFVTDLPESTAVVGVRTEVAA